MRFVLVIIAFVFSARAEITNVRVDGTTATQAVLSYTAPDQSPCSIEVSEFPSYGPLVHDVNATFFPGSDSDQQSGAVGSGRSRQVVIGKHGMMATGATNQFLGADGNRYSRALQANTTHYYRITCGSDTATGTFTTSEIKLGSTYPEPLPADATTPGTYNWPSVVNPSSRAESFVDPNTGALIRKVSLSSESLGGQTNTWPSGGNFQICSHTMISSGGHTYNLCVVYGTVTPSLVSIETDTGNVYGLSFIASRGGLGDCSYTPAIYGPAFSPTDGSKFYFVGQCVNPTRHSVFMARWTGPLNVSNALPSNSRTSHANLSVTLLTPLGLNPLMQAFDSGFDPAASPYWTPDGWAMGRILMHALKQQDDMAGWAVAFDPGNDLPIGSGGTGGITAAKAVWRDGASRWCTLHAHTTAGDNNPWTVIASNSTSQYYVTAAQDDGTGSVIHIQQAPNGSYEPYSSTAPNYLMDSQPGDLFFVNSNNVLTAEPIEIVSKDPVNHTWTVLRGNNLAASRFIQGSVLTAASHTPTRITTGMKLYPACRSVSLSTSVYPNGATLWWNFMSDPHGNGFTYPAVEGTASNQVVEHYATGEHQVNRDGANIMLRTTETMSRAWQYWVYPGGTPGYSLVSATNFASANPWFGGIDLGRYGVTRAYEGHPSFDQYAAPTAEQQWILDAEPMVYGSPFYPGSGTLVSGQASTYRIAGLTMHRKHLTTFASCGRKPLIDISSSAQGDMISDSTPYSFCVAGAANECRNGSSTGDVYVVCPGATQTTCYSDMLSTSSAIVDMCVGDSAGFSLGGVQSSFTLVDQNGAGGRLFSNLWSTHHGESRYQNVRQTSDGKWALFMSYNLTGTQEAYMAKLPPWPALESTRRDTFIPVLVSLSGPDTADNAIVEFGYAENGDPGKFYCTSRGETCVSQSETIVESQPFYFATTDAGLITGKPCASGCSITIPALPGRVVYYRVTYRDSQGGVVSRQPMAALPVP